jgi:anaerobic magnesium-protoporphyrin IX monomethyl ester cyclase
MARRVLLVNICYNYPLVTEGIFSAVNKIWPPLCLAYTTSLLVKEGVDVKLLDANALRIKPEATGDLSASYDMIFVSTSDYARWECPHLDLKPAISTCRSIREKNPSSQIFLVGTHGTVRPKEMIEMCGADAVVIGEPEYAIRDIAISGDWRKCDSIAYLEGDRLKINPRKMPVNLDEFPTPDFSQLPMNKYSFDLLGGDFTLIEAARGCPFSCFFCLKEMFGAYRKKSLENVKRDILYSIREFGVKRIFFVDLEFTINRTMVEGLCDWMIADNIRISWSCQTRLDSVDEGLLAKMKKAGCQLIMYGVESGSQRMLDLIGKNIRIEDFKKGMEATKRAGMDAICFFMVGFPTETQEEREATVTLALQLDPEYASFFLCRPYPGTRCHAQIKDSSPGLFPPGVGDEEELLILKKFCDRAFARFYYRPSYIIRRVVKGNFKLLSNQVRLFLHKAGWYNDT